MKAALFIFLCGLAAVTVSASGNDVEDHLLDLIGAADPAAHEMEALDLDMQNPVDIKKLNLRMAALTKMIQDAKQKKVVAAGAVAALQRMYDVEKGKCERERVTRRKEREIIKKLLEKLDLYDRTRPGEALLDVSDGDMLYNDLHELATNAFRKVFDVDLRFKEQVLLALKGQMGVKPQSRDIRNHLNELNNILKDETCHEMEKKKKELDAKEKEEAAYDVKASDLSNEYNNLAKAKDCGEVLNSCSGKHEDCKKSIPNLEKKIKDANQELEALEKKCAPLAHLYKIGTKQNPGLSCKDIKAKDKTADDGEYFIKPAGYHEPFEVSCDMTTKGGGWTAIISKTDCHNSGFQLTTASRRINGGTINTCGAKFSRDKLNGFNRLRGYSCGNWGVGWNISWKNVLHAKEMMVAATVQGDNYRSFAVDGRTVNPTKFYAGYGKCAFYNGNSKMNSPGQNKCWSTAFSDAAPLAVPCRGGSTISIYITTGYACKPDCKYGAGFNIQQWWVR